MEKDPPFKHAYDPLGSAQVAGAVKCPKCGAADFDVYSNAYGVHRTCRQCKNEWSGGGVGTFPDGAVPPPEMIPAEDDAYPIVQFTGGPHRRFGDDE